MTKIPENDPYKKDMLDVENKQKAQQINKGLKEAIKTENVDQFYEVLPKFDVLNDILYVYQTYNNDTTIFKNVGKPSKNIRMKFQQDYKRNLFLAKKVLL